MGVELHPPLRPLRFRRRGIRAPWCPAEDEEAATEPTAEELEHQRCAFDAARILGSYRWLHQGLKPPRTFARRES
jgi:hypothetical protein